MRTALHWTSIILAVTSSSACSLAPPSSELLDARAAYDRAKLGPAATTAPDRLEQARLALVAAERRRRVDAGSDEVRHLAYVAHRRILVVEAEARTAVAVTRMDRLREELARDDIARTAGPSLDREHDAPAILQLEREPLVDLAPLAERRAKNTIDGLRVLGPVKEGPEGAVVTLATSTLFETNSATLTESARERLDRVAAALVETGGSSISIAVFTSHADDARRARPHLELSRHRAEAVKSHLVGRGVTAGTLRAEGRGLSEPVASNASAEGRAANERVEIAVAAAGKR